LIRLQSVKLFFPLILPFIFLLTKKKGKDLHLAFQTVDKVPVFAGTFTMSTVFLV